MARISDPQLTHQIGDVAARGLSLLGHRRVVGVVGQLLEHPAPVRQAILDQIVKLLSLKYS